MFRRLFLHPSSVSALRADPPSPTRGEGLFAIVALLFFAFAPAAFARDEAPAPIHPALFVVRDSDSTIYLFGAIHARPRGADWGGPEAHQALAQAQDVWTELPFTDEANQAAQALVVQRGMAGPNETLSSWLNADQLARLRTATQSMNVPFSYVDHMRPWLAAITLSLLPAMQQGNDPDSGADRMAYREALAHGKTARAFETPEQQIGFISGMDEAAQRQMLLDALDSAGGSADDFNRLSRAWERGDTRLLERLVIKDLKKHYPDLYNTIFRDRNAAWVTTLDHEMQGTGVDFVAVGAGHLLGPDGLVTQMRARGYHVERVAAAP